MLWKGKQTLGGFWGLRSEMWISRQFQQSGNQNAGTHALVKRLSTLEPSSDPSIAKVKSDREFLNLPGKYV